MRTVASKLPDWAKKPIRRIRGAVKAMPYYGKGRFCPLCGKSSRRFRQYGAVLRENAQCVHCGALERHRLVWLFIQKQDRSF